jgi:hypothetical protein
VVPLTLSPDGAAWYIAAPGKRKKRYQRCSNLETPSLCNWLVTSDDARAGKPLCLSCRLNRTIPDLSIPENGEYWHRIELAKRRLISLLAALRLPIASKIGEDPERGLAFDFLRPDGAPVLTGHSGGVITLNIEEANDAHREHVREQMHEPYRTLLGHLRHETGHYYWDRLIQGSPWLENFRDLFGNETQDYQAALTRHYQQGAPPDWPSHHVSAYASVHPWEDWAETWAHYLHLVDTLDTAFSFHLDIESVELPFAAFGVDSLARAEEPNAAAFLELLNNWGRFTAVLNELSRSMGLPDFYPYVLSRDAVAKLHFVHTVVLTGEAQPQP